MKTTMLLKRDTIRLAVFAAFIIVFGGCIQKDLYDPAPEVPDPTPDEYFDFSTSAVVTLNIDYGIPDHSVAFEIYDKDPLTVIDEYHSVKATDIFPILSGYTNWNSVYEGTIKIPAGLKKAYIYTDGFGIPRVDEVAVTSAGIIFKQTITESGAGGASTRDEENSFDFNYSKGSAANLYYVSSPLGKWDITGKIEAQKKSPVIQGLTSRVQKIAPPTGDNSAFAKGKQYANLVTYKETVFNSRTGKTEGGTELTVKFLWEFAGYHNVLGYYYYPKGTVFTESSFKQLPKYLIFPNVSWNEAYAGNGRASLRPDYGATPLVEGSSVTLMYYGSNYNQLGTSIFPKDVEIGWFMMSDAFYTANKGGILKGNINGYLESDPMGNKTHLTYLGGNYTTGRPGSIYGSFNHLPYVFSNEEFNTNKVPGCITLFDEASNTIVLGFEDGDFRSYEDFLFYVTATPGVIDPGWVHTQQPVNTTVKSYYSGALAFEDMWPKKGDYDMNDVIVNYYSEVTTDANNNVVQLVDSFKVVNDGADYTDGFGYELGISPDAIESVTVDRKGLTSSFKTDAKGLESGQNGKSVIMLFDDHAKALNKVIVVKVKIKSGSAIKLGTGMLYPPYNPFIVAQANVNNGKDRKEVHLPKLYRPTNLAGRLGEMDDASTSTVWYVSKPDKDLVQYPFAISIPFDSSYKNFIPPTEKSIISNDYPNFVNWVKSGGTNYQTWYKQNNKK